MTISYAARTEVGLVRQANEDNYLVVPDFGLFAVCDGMGGHRGGNIASELACATLSDFLTGSHDQAADNGSTLDRSDQLALLIEAAVLAAHQKITQTSQADPAVAGMGTTCTAAMVASDDSVIMGHVGDSRLYLLSDGLVRQISEDHSLVNELLKSGTITPEEALIHPQSNIITQALGSTPAPRVEVQVVATRPGDTFMICSDGLSCYFPKASDLAEAMGREDLRCGVDEMIEKALAEGGRDNVTCVMFKV